LGVVLGINSLGDKGGQVYEYYLPSFVVYEGVNGGTNSVFDRNGAGSGAVNINTNGGSVFTAHVSQNSADINLSSDAITLTTGSNQNITLSPNGTGVVALSTSLTMPTGSSITYGSIANTSNGGWQFRTNSNTITGIEVACDVFYANTYRTQAGGGGIVFTTPATGLTLNNSCNLIFTG